MRVLVTGGAGFLGSAIVHRLLSRGYEVRILGRRPAPALAAAGVECHAGDVAELEAVRRALRGCGLVFHTAARAGVAGRPRDFERTNVQGTRNVLVACRESSVSRLVFTGSPSAVHAGGDLEGADESLPYPAHHEAPYPATKAAAERLVLAANGPELATVSLRPHLIWGPGDPHLVPRLVARARAGRLRLVGDGSNRVDSVTIDNAADAHLAAADRLRSSGDAPAGRAYFITNGEPLPIRTLVDGILAAAGLPPVTRCVPLWAALAAGYACEMLQRIRPAWDPPITRFVARQLATAHWFSIEAARRDLGYEPRVTIADGLAQLARWFAQGAPPRDVGAS